MYATSLKTGGSRERTELAGHRGASLKPDGWHRHPRRTAVASCRRRQLGRIRRRKYRGFGAKRLRGPFVANRKPTATVAVGFSRLGRYEGGVARAPPGRRLESIPVVDGARHQPRRGPHAHGVLRRCLKPARDSVNDEPPGHLSRELLIRDYPLVRSVLTSAVEDGETDLSIQLCGRLWYYWTVTGNLIEGLQYVEALIAASSTAPDEELGRAILTKGMLPMRLGRAVDAAECFEEAVAMHRRSGVTEYLKRSLEACGRCRRHPAPAQCLYAGVVAARAARGSRGRPRCARRRVEAGV